MNRKNIIDNKLREDIEIQLEYHCVGKHFGISDKDLSVAICDLLRKIADDIGPKDARP